ncbi:MAG: fibronectin type III domain-containing protein, partial [Fimbriimonadaceae bacterium]
MIAAIIFGSIVSIKPSHLRCNYLERPLAVVCKQPRLSWWVEDSRPNSRQSAYEIEIRGQGEATWSSRKVTSSANFAVVPTLKPERNYEWRIRLWDAEAERGAWSNWEPLSTELAKWQASWITVPRTIEPPVKPHNGFHSQLTKNAADQKWVEIDLGSTQDISKVVLFPATPFDWTPATPGFMFPVRFRLEVDGRTVYETSEDLAAPSTAMTIPLGGAKGQVIRLHCSKLRERRSDYGIAFAEIQVFSGSNNISQGKTVKASDSLENREWGAKNLTNGDTESHAMKGMNSLPVSYLQRGFAVQRQVKRATFKPQSGCLEQKTVTFLTLRPKMARRRCECARLR